MQIYETSTSLRNIAADSFTTMPIALNGAGIQPMKIVNWAEATFSTG
ncbi:hypothetical protein [Methylotenera sp.]|nr:hypothetical protein [Methylotenera sp.]MDO9205089.1 hypothetical protein [Methylotenera sp.]MDP2070254.1 hypothetical protein [Methylotenera sp.]MDP3307227.1 hypothetical protein [Methylotenera sp.]